MTPEQATIVLQEIYLPQIRNEQKTTRRVIESIPAGKGDYKPDPKSMSAMELAKHIAGSELFFLNAVANGKFSGADAAIPESVQTPAELGAWHEENLLKATEKLAALKGDDLVKTISLGGVFNLPALNYAQLMISHSAHHRGQLSAYLRPMGGRVPRIYGGSADDPIELPQAQGQSH